MSTETDVSMTEHGRWPNQLEDIYGRVNHFARVYTYPGIRRASAREGTGR